MKSLSSVGIGLSVVFTFLFLALIAELYYLFWWKKRLTNDTSQIESYDHTSPAKELFYMLCWRKNSAFAHSSISTTTTRRQQLTNRNDNNDSSSSTSNDHNFLFKPFGDDDSEENEFVRLRNYHYYPPRFLFTIVEETKEELESEDGKSCKSRNVSLGDLLVTLEETPYLTPLASPPFFTPPLTPAQTSLLSPHSPPPKLRFLREAEEKMNRRSMENDENYDDDDDEDESFITITVDHRIKLVQHYNNDSSRSDCSQVLPLSCSSPSNFPT